MSRRPTTPFAAVLAGLLVPVALLAGCAAPTPPPPLAPPLPQAAEPAVSPPPGTAPAGTLVSVGAQPEGVVADPVTHLVAVGVRQPNQLVLLDDRTGRITDRVALPGHLRHLQLAEPGGPVLVPDEDSGRLLTVALPAGRITASVPTGKSPHDATAAGNGDLFAADEAGATVAVVRDGTVAHRFTDVVQPAGLAAVGNLVGLVDVRQNSLHVYDAAALRTVAQLPAGDGPTHVVADRDGRLAVVDTRGGQLLFYRLTPTPQRIGSMPLPGTPYGVAYDRTRDELWVTLTARNQLTGISLAGGTPRITAVYPTVRQPNTVAVDPATGALFVTGTDTGQVQIIRP